ILLDPGASGEVTFTAPASGTYQFVCTFPGHNFTMFGDFIVN
ncbi:MAG: azurin, partial [SAR202 cluster bacterium]|nr:azurin [SAR202 cluster bacterium]